MNEFHKHLIKQTPFFGITKESGYLNFCQLR